MHWQSCMRNQRIRRKHSCERGFDISEKLIISGYDFKTRSCDFVCGQLVITVPAIRYENVMELEI